MATPDTAAGPAAATVPAEPDPATETGFRLAPGVLLRIEGGLLFVVAVAIYAQLDASWWLLAGLFLVPDVGLAGYLLGPRAGALAYNLTHTLAGPFALGLLGFAFHGGMLWTIATIWVAHIGVDRAFGFGLKYLAGARHTHLQRLA